MHYRNIYKENPPNFIELANKYENFKKFILINKYGNPTINWKDPLAMRELTKILLHHDFGINIELPINQLIPTVTNRINYIHWIEDLLNQEEKKIIIEDIKKGIDIGTGASCIYPLLGISLHKNWKFLATEIDPISIKYAKHNIYLNNWEDKIEVRQVYKKETILLDVLKSEEKFDFCMCNPPFFSSIDDIGKNTKTICTGTNNEMITEGGEKSFILQLIKDSLILKDKIKWYTTMIGRKIDLKYLIKELQNNKIINIRTTEFYQGRTTRWALGWSFSKDGLEEFIKKKTLPKSSQLKKNTIISLINKEPKEIIKKIENILQILDINFITDPITYFIKGEVFQETWLENISTTIHHEKPLFLFHLQLLQIQPQQYLIDLQFKGGSNKESFYQFFNYFNNAMKT